MIKMCVMRSGNGRIMQGLLRVTLVASAFAAGQPSPLPPAELVRRAVQNEVAENDGSGTHFMFKDDRKTAHLWETKLIVETSEAAAGLLIAQDGHPLTPQQKSAEAARLQNYINNPEEVKKKQKQ